MRLAFAIAASLSLCACEPRREPAAEATGTSSRPVAVATPVAPTPASSTAAPAPPTTSLSLSPAGIGPLRFGMTPAEATAALGAPVVVSDDFGTDPQQCNYAKSTALPGVSLMVDGGRVVRADLLDATVPTDKGLRRGDTAAAVREAYGAALTETAHKYVDAPAAYLESWNAERSRGVRYEIDQTGKVSLIYAGGEQVGYVEGCA